MMIDRLHYITQEGLKGEGHLEMMSRACDNGVKWVQLRIKDTNKDDILSIAKASRELTLAKNAKLIINDHADIAKMVNADGVHVGQKDMPVKEARKILGDNALIGGTANDLDTILRHADEGADYVGVGPFRFTISKKDLSPVLGIEGYERIIDGLAKHGITIPVIAIGGIVISDLEVLGSSGVHGIAVASLINHSEAPGSLIKDIYNKIEKWKN